MKSVFLTNIHHAYAQTDGTYAFPNSREGDMLKRAYGSAWTDSPELFNADPTKTYIGQVQASREGVNLSSAEHLVFVGIDFAALSYLQGRDRASYLGRKIAPQVHWIFADGGMEPKVYHTVRGKEHFTQAHFRASKNQQEYEKGIDV